MHLRVLEQGIDTATTQGQPMFGTLSMLCERRRRGEHSVDINQRWRVTMTTNHEVRNAWTADRDEAFFRIVQALFPPAWLSAASELLASYDDTNDYLTAARRSLSPPR